MDLVMPFSIRSENRDAGRGSVRVSSGLSSGAWASLLLRPFLACDRKQASKQTNPHLSRTQLSSSPSSLLVCFQLGLQALSLLPPPLGPPLPNPTHLGGCLPLGTSEVRLFISIRLHLLHAISGTLSHLRPAAAATRAPPWLILARDYLTHTHTHLRALAPQNIKHSQQNNNIQDVQAGKKRCLVVFVMSPSAASPSVSSSLSRRVSRNSVGTNVAQDKLPPPAGRVLISPCTIDETCLIRHHPSRGALSKGGIYHSSVPTAPQGPEQRLLLLTIKRMYDDT
ncbi:hypothetical protein LZ32DRAFT_611093 [Colletotrichum eremochloae]|nr:hypothetical protein LZ32DRAFT_611093 [Colletotrichum eremochloae]